MPELKVNEDVKVTVLAITPNADSFKNSNQVTIYCHTCSFLLADEQTEVKAQICLDTPTISYFEVGDKIEIYIKDYKPGKNPPYTIKFVDMIARKGQLDIKGASPAMVSAKNPMVRGTVIDRALELSVLLYQHQKPPVGKSIDVNLIINTAKVFQDYFNNELEP